MAERKQISKWQRNLNNKFRIYGWSVWPASNDAVDGCIRPFEEYEYCGVVVNVNGICHQVKLSLS